MRGVEPAVALPWGGRTGHTGYRGRLALKQAGNAERNRRRTA
jgi:hypothetical protein